MSQAPDGFALRGVTVRYGAHVALRDVDLDLAGGRLSALLGPSGCGKSSLLMALNRLTDLIDDCRVTGTIHHGATAVHDPRLDVQRLRRRVGLVFQQPNPFPISIARNLLLPLAAHGVARRERRARVEQALVDVGLWDEVRDRLDQPATQLSGGQQQRLCIARALALAPDVLLLDEPCAALDPRAAARVEDLLLRLRGRYTLVMVTHHPARARRLADAVALFAQRDGAGAMVECGPTAQVLGAPQSPEGRSYLADERF
ncbi:MAG: ATP-binding cassette domain-containing protein [Acidobacteriota bacterium]